MAKAAVRAGVVTRGLERLRRDIVACTQCDRLVTHCREVARVRRRAYRDEEYWGRPVPGFGDASASMLLVGLAPGAHGANRTGRMFTGDRSGEFLYASLHRAGLANRATASSRDDGLVLTGVYITNACRCAPPGNRPTAEEMERCAPFLDRELDHLRSVTVVLALGKVAWDAVLRRAARIAPDGVPRPRPAFGHGARARVQIRSERPPVWLLGSYHPSQQNTQTGRLTRAMFDRVIRRGVKLSG